MATDEDQIDERDFQPRCGNDSTPLMSLVPEPPPAHWGRMTSTARTLSPQYLAFLGKHKEVRRGSGQ
jgi:hypothetical protein